MTASDRLESPPFVPRGRRAAALGALAVLVATTGAGGVKVAQTARGASADCKKPPIVQVVAPDAIANSIQSAAKSVEESHRVCAQYVVSAQDPGDTYQSIVMSPSSAPAVWITDSPAWIDLVNKKLGDGWLTPGDTFATSPVVLGVPSSLKTKTEGKAPSWFDALDSSYPIGLVDTNASTSSLLGVVAANQQATTNAKRSDLMRNILRVSRALSTAGMMTQKAKAGADRASVFPISEQQLIQFNQANPSTPLTPLIPQGGVKQLQYQWVTPVRGTGAPQVALDALEEQLTSPAAVSALRIQGFRDVNGSPLTGVGVPGRPQKMPEASPAETVGADTAWNNLKKDARMLVLIDVSGSMRTKASGNATRIDLLQTMATAAVDILPATTRLGAWAFSSDLQSGNRDYLPLTTGEPPLTSKESRETLKTKAKTLPDLVKRNGDTGLYDSIAAAYDSVSDSYDDNYINSVVVMTDGANDDPNGGLDLKQLLSKLKSRYNVNKPVKIVTIAIGGDADPAALKQIASATDGLSYTTTTPDQIASVFVDAFLRRTN